jgi:GTP-binding protein
MNFVDEVEIEVTSGRGGDGCISFRRERYRPKGGPDGGDGGRGGSIILQADPGLTTLLDQRYTRSYKARNGQPGMGSDRYGAAAADVTVRIPVGTLVFDAESQELLADLDHQGAQVVVARGGQGGKGNIHFKSPTHQAPRKAEPGQDGEHRRLRLELKLLADVGVVGFPNTGKSTLVARMSRARPKIADYPFTTLAPTLGVVSLGEHNSFVMADVPGLIEGASQGHGLGHRFLRHVERCRLLIHLTTWMPGDPEGPEPLLERLDILEREMALYSPQLVEKPRLVAVSKLDLSEVRERLEPLRAALAARGVELLAFSAATSEGLDRLLGAIAQRLPPIESSQESDPI